MKKVSIYIPVYNGALYLERSLESIFQQTVPFNEIIVVDDGSQDNSVSISQRYPLKIISHNYNRGVALARNTGVRNCHCELVASIDVDCVLDKYWLEKCISFFDDVSVAGVGGMLYEAVHTTIADRWRRTNLVQHFGNETKSVMYLSGSNTLYRKSDLVRVGLYDPRFHQHHEDTDISERLIRSGKKLIYAANARVSHIKKDTVHSVMRTCWGFRHRTYPRTWGALVKDICCELKHVISIVGKSMVNKRVRLLALDSIYIFFQVYFSIKAYFLQTTNFK